MRCRGHSRIAPNDTKLNLIKKIINASLTQLNCDSSKQKKSAWQFWPAFFFSCELSCEIGLDNDAHCYREIMTIKPICVYEFLEPEPHVLSCIDRETCCCSVVVAATLWLSPPFYQQCTVMRLWNFRFVQVWFDVIHSYARSNDAGRHTSGQTPMPFT